VAANRRILYNRASADAQAGPGIHPPGHRLERHGLGRRDVPDIAPNSPPASTARSSWFRKGGRLYAPSLNDGPFAEHYEAIEAAIANPLHPKVTSNPASIRFRSDKDVYGTRDQFPVVCSTYRLTELYHYWTHHTNELNQLQPGFFIEIPEELAREKESPTARGRGSPRAARLRRGSRHGDQAPAKDDHRRQVVWHIGFPLHWGYEGDPKHVGPLANFLTPSAMDPNTWTPEFKTFLVGSRRPGASVMTPTRWRCGSRPPAFGDRRPSCAT